jgi:hypothetical protein
MQELVEYSFQHCAPANFYSEHKSFLHNDFDSHIVTYILGMEKDSRDIPKGINGYNLASACSLKAKWERGCWLFSKGDCGPPK